MAITVATLVFGSIMLSGAVIGADTETAAPRRALVVTATLLAFASGGLGWLTADRMARPLTASLDALAADVEAQRRAGAESEERFRALAEAIPAILFVTDSRGHTTYLNPQFARFTGRSIAEMKGEGWVSVLHPDDRARTASVWADAVRSGADYEIEYRFRRHDGAWRWFLGRGVPQRDAEGRILRWLGICTDVHERRGAEQALRDSEERLRLGAQVAGFGTFEWWAAEDRHLWSAELRAMVGLSPDEPLSLDRWLALVHDDDRPRVAAAITDLLVPGTGATIDLEHRIVRPDGEVRWLHACWRTFPVPALGGVSDRVVGVVRDVTDRRAAEAAQRRARAEMLHASRLSLIGEVASTIAHEVNQPLGAAANYLEVARAMAGEGPLADVLARVRGEVTRATETVRKVRSFAADRALEPRPEPLPALVQDAVSLALLGDRGEGVTVSYALAEDAQSVLVDRVQFQQVIVNLVRNAADAMASAPRKEIRIAAAVVPDTGMVEIAVADSGHGIAADLLPRLFTAFTTTRPDGTGLGLSTSRSIVEAHGGRLWAEAPRDGGAVFRLSIPLATADAHA